MILKNAETAMFYTAEHTGRGTMGEEKRALLERMGVIDTMAIQRRNGVEGDLRECEYCHSKQYRCTDPLAANGCVRVPQSERASLCGDFT